MNYRRRCILFYLIFLFMVVDGTILGQTKNMTAANQSLNNILSSFVNSNGMVDYGSIQNNPFLLQPFIEFLAEKSPVSHPEIFPTEDDKKAYWINAYNGLMIKAVIENPGISSVKQIGWGYGVFWRKRFMVGGEKLTLNHIEHKILRKQFDDPRIHFAINCASNSCPPIGNRIVVGKNLDQQLDQKTKDFINNTENVQIDVKTKTIIISKIFKWYKADFEINGNSLIDYINNYKDGTKIDSSYDITFQDYDWGLNNQSQLKE